MFFNWTDKDEKELEETINRLDKLKWRKEMHEKERRKNQETAAWTASFPSKLKSTF